MKQQATLKMNEPYSSKITSELSMSENSELILARTLNQPEYATEEMVKAIKNL